MSLSLKLQQPIQGRPRRTKLQNRKAKRAHKVQPINPTSVLKHEKIVRERKANTRRKGENKQQGNRVQKEV